MDFTFTFWQHRRDLWAFPIHPLSSCHVISSLQAAGQSRGFVQVPATHGRAQRSSRSIQTEEDFPPKTGPVRAEAGVAVCGQQSLASLLPPELDNTSNVQPAGVTPGASPASFVILQPDAAPEFSLLRMTAADGGWQENRGTLLRFSSPSLRLFEDADGKALYEVCVKVRILRTLAESVHPGPKIRSFTARQMLPPELHVWSSQTGHMAYKEK
ncbi:hypothetical protein SRHO_G00073690 [Serrasalmus rhombeus]